MRTLAWDIDDVLNDLMRVWLETWWRPAHPGCEVAFEQIVENPPHRILDTTLPEYLSSLDAFRQSDQFPRLAPRPEVLGWFTDHGERFRHLALTAVPLRCAHASAAWVMRHFGRWIRSFHVIPSPREDEQIPGYDRSKEEFLRRALGIAALIDDNVGNVSGADRAGVRGLLFPRPWNNSRRTIEQTLGELMKL
jgi:hypothetical protein